MSVGLDARRIDDEMINLFKHHIDRCFSPFNFEGYYHFQPEFKAVAYFFLWWTSLLKNKSTPGMTLMNLKYFDRYSNIATAEIPLAKKIAYLICWVLLPWAFSRVQRLMQSKGWQFSPLGTYERRTWAVVNCCDMIFKYAKLFNLICFFGGTNKDCPTLCERISGIGFVESSQEHERSYNFQYLYRHLVWETFSSFAMFAGPLVRNSAFQWLQYLKQQLTPTPSSILRGNIVFERHFLTDNANSSHNAEKRTQEAKEYVVGACRSCGTTPASTPYVLSCGHTFCYYCVVGSYHCEENQHFCCFCGQLSHESTPWEEWKRKLS